MGCRPHRLTPINLNTIAEISLRLCRKCRKTVFRHIKRNAVFFTYTQFQKMGYPYERVKRLPYVKEGLPRYPALQEFDFNRDCMDIRHRYEELFEKKPRVKKKETER